MNSEIWGLTIRNRSRDRELVDTRIRCRRRRVARPRIWIPCRYSASHVSRKTTRDAEAHGCRLIAAEIVEEQLDSLFLLKRMRARRAYKQLEVLSSHDDGR